MIFVSTWYIDSSLQVCDIFKNHCHDDDRGKPWGFSSCEWSPPSCSCQSAGLCKLPTAPENWNIRPGSHKIKIKYDQKMMLIRVPDYVSCQPLLAQNIIKLKYIIRISHMTWWSENISGVILKYMIIIRKWGRSLNILKLKYIFRIRKYFPSSNWNIWLWSENYTDQTSHTMWKKNLFLNSTFKKLVNILEIPRHCQQCNIFSQISLDIIYNPKLVSKLEIAPSLKVRKLDIHNCHWNPSGFWSKIIGNN